MIPLTAVPLLVYHTRDDVGRLIYLRARYALLPPETPELSQAAAGAAVSRLGERYRGVPVLVYHGIGRATTDTDSERFSVSRERFAEQMQMLRGAGYEAITAAELALYLRTADPDVLPARPILITFDDARADVMLQADRVLQDTGMRATMFVLGERTDSGNLIYAGWSDLETYAESERWEIGSHTQDLHELRDRDGARVSALLDRHAGESIDDYRARVVADLDGSRDMLMEKVGLEPMAFAYPHGDGGRGADPAALETLERALGERFELAFEQQAGSGWRNALPGDDPLHVARLEAEDWAGSALLDRLDAASALAEAVHDERALDYAFTDAELLVAATGMRCAPGVAGGVVESGVALGDQKLVALTFEDGPSVYTPQILDVLRSDGGVATFFVLGSRVEGRERLLQRMLVEGSEIGNHGMADRQGETVSAAAFRDEVDEANRRIGAAVPRHLCLVRPPSERDVLSAGNSSPALGLQTTLWSLDAEDTAGATPAEIAARVLAGLRPGAIVRLHDGGGARWATVQAVPIILAELERRGYEAVTVSQLLAAQVGEEDESGDVARDEAAWTPALMPPVAEAETLPGPVPHERHAAATDS